MEKVYLKAGQNGEGGVSQVVVLAKACGEVKSVVVWKWAMEFRIEIHLHSGPK